MSTSRHSRNKSDVRADYMSAQYKNPSSQAWYITDRRATHFHPNNLEHFADNSRHGGDEIELMNVETLIEAALLSDDSEQIARCTGKAVERLSSLREKSRRFNIVSDTTLRADVIDAYLPFYGILADTKKLPQAKIGTYVMGRLTEIAVDISDKWECYGAKVRGQYRAAQITGCASEIAALLLLQRFADEKIGDGTWWPAPTTVTDAKLHSRKSQFNGNWDINCFTQLGDTPELSYRLEVKSSLDALERSNRGYGDGITVVALREEVLTGVSGKAWPIRNMLSLFDRANPEPRVYCRDPDSVLDDMTDRLLDKLDS